MKYIQSLSYNTSLWAVLLVAPGCTQAQKEVAMCFTLYFLLSFCALIWEDLCDNKCLMELKQEVIDLFLKIQSLIHNQLLRNS